MNNNAKTCTCMDCKLVFVPSLSFDFYQEGSNPEVGRCENCMIVNAFGSESNEPFPLPAEYYKERVCKVGKGEKTCSFLGFNNGSVLSCMKGSDMESIIMAKLAENTMKAKGDNCSGPPNFKPQ